MRLSLNAGHSLTLLLGPVSAPEGLLKHLRYSVRERARKGQEEERERWWRWVGGALTMLVLIKLVRNGFPVSKHMRV